MERNEVLAELNKVFKKVFENNEMTISEETKAEDIERWDSMHHIMLLKGIQDVFKIKLPFKQAARVRKVNDMLDLIMKSLPSTAG